MQDISNSLRQRLAARPQPQTHPDANTLTAYVEQVLPAAERGRVTEHLAECSDCREVVSLSLPELQPRQLVVQVPGRSPWWIPGFRWATLAATIAIAATLIVEKTRQPKTAATPKPQETVALSDASKIAPLPANQPTAPSPNKSTLATRASIPRESEAGEPRVAHPVASAAARLASQPPPKVGIVGGVSVGAQIDRITAIRRPLMVSAADTAPAGTGAAAAVSANGAVPVRNESVSADKSVEATAAAPVLPVAPEPQAAAKADAADLRKYTPALSASNTDRTDSIPITTPSVSSAQPPPSAEDNNLGTTASFGKRAKRMATAVKNVMEKAAPGKPPAASQGFAATMAAPKVTAKPDQEFKQEKLPQKIHWSVTPDGRLINSTDSVKWHEVQMQNPDIQFRVVVTEGRHVWAGGNNATLIHSWNGGVNWETLKVPEGGDITDISIDQDLQVKTSNGQTYVSTDHGQTWVPLQQPK